mmetsp:Transcript_54443/g.129746  ORF Transcript_54443/g.129746 Transcript_54443/m.129746 type:complete len:334 (+) Transcript_54443:97-1098(+)
MRLCFLARCCRCCSASLKEAEASEEPASSSCRLRAPTRSESTLLMMLFVNTSLAVAQVACGMAANSLSLLGDGVLMFVDSISYVINLAIETGKSDEEGRSKLDSVGAAVSISLLAVTTIWMLLQSAQRLLPDDSEDDDEDVSVNGLIMIIFTVVNLVADAFVILASWLCGAGDMLMGEEGGNMNLKSAFAHLGADVVRGIAVLVAGIVAVLGWADGATSDAWCSLFVCVFILFAAFGLLQTLLRRLSPGGTYDNFDEEEEQQREQERTPLPPAAQPQQNVPPPVCLGTPGDNSPTYSSPKGVGVTTECTSSTTVVETERSAAKASSDHPSEEV